MPYKKINLFPILVMIAGILFPCIVYGQPGSLDTTFGINGKVRTDINEEYDGGWVDAILQPDGKILVTGHSANHVALIRYNTDGSLDKSFGQEGIVNNIIGTGTSLAVQHDGKILVAGIGDMNDTIRKNPIFLLIRYNSDGSLDNSFGLNGIVKTNLFSILDYAMAIGIQQDGKIVVAGQSFTSRSPSVNVDFAMVRYHADGTIDSGFGNKGIVITDFGTDEDRAWDMAIQKDGKILLAGDAGNFNTNYSDFALARYNTNGSLDTSFNHTGMVRTDFEDSHDAIWSVALQEDGKIVAGGNTYKWWMENADFGIARYNKDGSLDKTFGSAGLVISDFTKRYELIMSIAIQKNGQILVAGGVDVNTKNVSLTGFQTHFALARYQPNGDVDKNFGIDGIAIHHMEVHNSAWSVLIQDDGKIIIAGDTDSSLIHDFALLRFNGCNTIDNTVSQKGGVLTANQPNAIYQWINCDKNNEPIAGATQQTYHPNTNGNYAVVISMDVCRATSGCYKLRMEP